jgi:hypothetical protein
MAKTIRLTENDLVKLTKKIIEEMDVSNVSGFAETLSNQSETLENIFKQIQGKYENSSDECNELKAAIGIYGTASMLASKKLTGFAQQAVLENDVLNRLKIMTDLLKAHKEMVDNWVNLSQMVKK